MNVPFKARIAAQDLREAIAATPLNAIRIAETLSGLSTTLGGGSLLDKAWTAPMQVAYLVALVVEKIAAEEESKVLNMHGVPVQRLRPAGLPVFEEGTGSDLDPDGPKAA